MVVASASRDGTQKCLVSRSFKIFKDKVNWVYSTVKFTSLIPRTRTKYQRKLKDAVIILAPRGVNII